MNRRSPGENYRKGMALADLLRLFPDDATVRRWFVERC